MALDCDNTLLAETPGIRVDSLVFVDDSPAEVAEMRAAWPQVRSVQIPEDPARIVDEVTRHRPFGRLRTTRQDARRTEMMAGESLRAESARFVPTAKNAAAADFLPRHGFREDSGLWRAALSDVPRTPPHVTALPPAGPAAPPA